MASIAHVLHKKATTRENKTKTSSVTTLSPFRTTAIHMKSVPPPFIGGLISWAAGGLISRGFTPVYITWEQDPIKTEQTERHASVLPLTRNETDGGWLMRMENPGREIYCPEHLHVTMINIHGANGQDE